MNILWVKAGGLVPPDSGGKIRSYNLLRHLAQRHSVTFFSFHAAHADDAHAELERIFERVVLVPLDLPAPKSFAESLAWGRALLARQPYNIFKYCQPKVRTALHRLLREQTYDVMICDFLIAAGVIPWDLPTPKVLFTHNVESVIWKRHWETARNPLWKALAWREWRAMAQDEPMYLRQADHVLTVSEDDSTFFHQYLDPSKLSVIPTGVDTEYFQPSSAPEHRNSIVFVGSMDWLPNEDAVVYFINEILPVIRKQVPNTSLCVAGRNPSPRLQALAGRENNVQLTGWVEDVRPFLANAAICVVPLRIGGGTRLKIFEAMAMGKAVVATTVGAEGLPVRHKEHLLIADGPAAFAASTIELLCDPAKRRQLALAARKLVHENYSWGHAAQRFDEVLSAVVAKAHEPVA